jgi:hypothetical protein
MVHPNSWMKIALSLHWKSQLVLPKKIEIKIPASKVIIFKARRDDQSKRIMGELYPLLTMALLYIILSESLFWNAWNVDADLGAVYT